MSSCAGFEIGKRSVPGTIGLQRAGQRQDLPDADIDAGADLRNCSSSGESTDGNAPSGAPIVKRRLDVAGSNGSAVATTRRACARISAIGSASSSARTVGTTPFGVLQEKRVVEQPAQPRKAVADGRGREVEALGGAADMALLAHRLEQHEEVEVDPAEINFVQHIPEIVSLDA